MQIITSVPKLAEVFAKEVKTNLCLILVVRIHVLLELIWAMGKTTPIAIWTVLVLRIVFT